MVDARLPGRWLTDPVHDNLSDGAYRVLHNALMFCAEHGTDGALARVQLRFLYPGPIDAAWLEEIERAGLWTPTPEGFALAGWSTTLGQSTADQVNAYRENNRNRQRALREKRKQAGVGGASGGSVEPQTPNHPTSDGEAPRSEVDTGDVTRDVPRDVGKARQGKALPKEPSLEVVAPNTENASSEFDLAEPPQDRADNEPRPYPDQCERHQLGTHSAPCHACGQARKAHARSQRDTSSTPKLRNRTIAGRRICDNHPHVPTSAGDCANCEIHADDLAALLIGATA